MRVEYSVDEKAVDRLGQHLKSQAGYACLHDDARRDVAREFLTAATHPHSPDAADSGRITDEVVDAALFSETTDEYGDPTAMLIDFMGMGSTEKLGLARRSVRAALEAALAAQGQGEAVDKVEAHKSYGAIDRWLRNNMDDEEYAEYSAELDRVFSYRPSPPASPAGVPDATEVHADLPPGYRMATRDGDYWPLFGDSYCTGHAFPTRELAALEAWKQAHEKLNGSMASIRRFAAAPSATPEGGEVGL